MRYYITIVVFSISLLCHANDVQRIIGRFQEIFLKSLPSTLDDEVDNKLALFDKEGRCKSINYSSKGRVIWEPSRHYYAIKLMAGAYVTPESRYYKDDSLYLMILKGLEFWYREEPKSDNWWWGQIDEQLSIGETLLLMRKGREKIPKVLEDSLIVRMKLKGGTPKRWTGANKVHIAQHWLYRGLLTNDKELLDIAISYLYEPISYDDSRGESFQVDGSFFQHGQQLYLGGYAELLLKSILKVALAVKGTRYELGEQKLG